MNERHGCCADCVVSGKKNEQSTYQTDRGKMLIAVLVLLTIVIWAGIPYFYYRKDIEKWFDNRFGKS